MVKSGTTPDGSASKRRTSILSSTMMNVIENVVNVMMGICGKRRFPRCIAAGVGWQRSIFIAVTSGDEMNILGCMLAKMGAKHTIARVRNPQYTKLPVYMRDELSSPSMSINPEFEAANEIFRVFCRCRRPWRSILFQRVDLSGEICAKLKLNGKGHCCFRVFKVNILDLRVERKGEVRSYRTVICHAAARG